MATGTYAPDPFEQYCDDDGNPLSSGSLTVYSAGTSTPVNTYSDVSLTTPNTNPISLDAAGRPTSGAIFLTPGVSYKFILMDSLGATVATRDNIAAVPLNPNVSGTWVPVIGGSTSTSGQTYVFQRGVYTKLGAIVIATFSVQMSAKGAIVGAVQIQGFPFANGNSSIAFPGSIDFWSGTSSLFGALAFYLTPSTTSATIIGIGNPTQSFSSSIATTDIMDTFTIAGTLIYTASS